MLLQTLRVAFACRLGVVIETKHSSHMDHGALFNGPGERYDACMQCRRRMDSKEGNRNLRWQ